MLTSANVCFPKRVTTILKSILPQMTAAMPSRGNTPLPYFRKRSEFMSKKAFRPPRLAPLQRVVAEAITDPAELAAMDEVRKRQKRKGRPAMKDRKGVKN